jgi:signal transduction histidine kinase
VQRETVRIFVEQLRRELSPFKGTGPINVQYDIQNTVPPIETDRGKLKSIISHFLSNAPKFTDEGGVKLRGINEVGGKEVSFIVSDTGIRIPKDQLPMLFDKFHQVDGSTSKRYSGTGLGLTISNNLVVLLGGRIGVESE